MGLRKKEPVVYIIFILVFGVLLYFIAYPLYAVFRESVMNAVGKFIGLVDDIQFIQSACFRQVSYNTLFINAFAFIRAVTELSSTIFRVTPRWRVMAVDIYNMVESGARGGAAGKFLLKIPPRPPGGGWGHLNNGISFSVFSGSRS